MGLGINVLLAVKEDAPVIYRIKWLWWAIVQEALKLKFKAVLRTLYDPQYRKDITYLWMKLSRGKLKAREDFMPLWKIHFSHSINYPGWVTHLTQRIHQGEEFPPIKVIKDSNPDGDWDRHMVVDGNHRLLAMKMTMPDTAMVHVKLLEYVDERETL